MRQIVLEGPAQQQPSNNFIVSESIVRCIFCNSFATPLSARLEECKIEECKIEDWKSVILKERMIERA